MRRLLKSNRRSPFDFDRFRDLRSGQAFDSLPLHSIQGPVAQDDIRFLLAQDDNSILKQVSEKEYKRQQPLLTPDP